MRAVHWEHLAAHKQRELSQMVGVHIPDETFNKEYSTVMHDAVHRAVTGQFTEPSQEGFVPHSHKVPLQTALDVVRDEGSKMGLAGHHDLVRKSEDPKFYEVKLAKAWPKSPEENASNANAHAVMEDAILEGGGSKQESFDHIPLAQEQFVPGLGTVDHHNRDSDSQCLNCGSDIEPEIDEDGYYGDNDGVVYPDFCPNCERQSTGGSERTHTARRANLAQDHEINPSRFNYGALVEPHSTDEQVNEAVWDPVNNEPPMESKGVPAPDRSAWSRSPLMRRKKAQ
jgi:hypothetical protein